MRYTLFVCLNEIYLNNMIERKRLQKRPSGKFILWQPINFEILTCSYFFMLFLSSYIFWIRNKQKQRITWNQMHWFLPEQSSTNLKNILNICVCKLSFFYFYHEEIYLLHENFHKFLLKSLFIKLNMIVEMENYEFEVKRDIDTIRPRYFIILYLSWNSFTSLVWCHFWLQILTKKNILAFE